MEHCIEYVPKVDHKMSCQHLWFLKYFNWLMTMCLRDINDSRKMDRELDRFLWVNTPKQRARAPMRDRPQAKKPLEIDEKDIKGPLPGLKRVLNISWLS